MKPQYFDTETIAEIEYLEQRSIAYAKKQVGKPHHETGYIFTQEDIDERIARIKACYAILRQGLE